MFQNNGKYLPLATLEAVDTAAGVPKVRLVVVAELPGATVEAPAKENPPIAGADVVVAAGLLSPKLNPPVGAVGAGAADVVAGAPKENPAVGAAAVVVVLPSPKPREGVLEGVGAPKERGLFAGAPKDRESH